MILFFSFTIVDIVSFLGLFSSPEGISYLVFEFIELGSLDGILKNKGENFKYEELIQMSKGIAKGMAYLEGSKIVHRDLSAR
jgi:serine/threonine protein kinase